MLCGVALFDSLPIPIFIFLPLSLCVCRIICIIRRTQRPMNYTTDDDDDHLEIICEFTEQWIVVDVRWNCVR